MAKIQARNVNRTVAQPVNQTSQTVHESVKDYEFDAVNLSRDERKRQLLDDLTDIYIDDSSGILCRFVINVQQLYERYFQDYCVLIW